MGGYPAISVPAKGAAHVDEVAKGAPPCLAQEVGNCACAGKVSIWQNQLDRLCALTVGKLVCTHIADFIGKNDDTHSSLQPRKSISTEFAVSVVDDDHENKATAEVLSPLRS